MKHTVRESDRKILAAVLMFDAGARKAFTHLMHMGAKDIHCDHMLIRQPDGRYASFSDPGAWNAYLDCRGDRMGICMIQSKDGTWFLNG